VIAMFRKLIIAAVAAGILGLAAFWFLTIPQSVPASVFGPYTPDLANGKTMFAIGGCASCHAVPKQQDRTRLGGGLALKSPFGTFYAPNISPDAKDGIGGWTEVQFASALMKGTSPSGEHYYPAFPYASYQRMEISDVRDLFAYLKTLPPISGVVRDHDLPFPFNIRRMLGGWKMLFLYGGPYRPDPAQSTQLNRGNYLVNGPGHCAECHSPRNVLGGIVSSMRFTGGPAPDGEGNVPNITQFRMKSWSVADIADFLDSGMTPDGDSAGGSMVDVIRNTSQLSKEDREAMAVYIKSLPAVEGRAPKKKQ
jgi:mono/diheme cytochrome c family protein